MELLILALILLIVYLVIRNNYRSISIFEYERGLKYVKGKFTGLLEPGRYKYYMLTTMIKTIDIRPSFVTVSGQEVLSSDGISLKATIAAKYQVKDPVKAVNSIDDYHTALYLVLQMGLREVVGSSAIDDIIAKKDELGASLMEKTSAEIESFGLELLSADIKDIMLPGEVKKLFNQIVKARKEGMALLEKARGESAAMRSLLNVSKILEDNPALFRLRILQQISESTGNTFVIGVDDQIAKTAGSSVNKIESQPSEDAGQDI